MFLKFLHILLISVVIVCYVAHAHAHVRTIYEFGINNTVIKLINNIRGPHHRHQMAKNISESTESSESMEYLDSQTNPVPIETYSYCEPEEFVHYYIISSTEKRLMNNMWQRTLAFETGVLENLCLLPNGLPIQRKCIVNESFQTVWENISHWPQIRCYHDVKENIITPQLHSLYEGILDGNRTLNSKQERLNVTKSMAQLIERRDYKPIPADIYYSSKLLNAVTTNRTDDETLKNDIMDIFDKISSIDENVLRISAEINATNILLDTFEQYMDSLSQEFISQNSCSIPQSADKNGNDENQTQNYLYAGVRTEFSTEVSIFFINPNCANISGIAIYENSSNIEFPTLQDSNSNNNIQFRFLYLNESIDELLNESKLVVATFLPTDLWEEVLTTFQRKRHKVNPIIVVKVYKNDNIFIDNNLTQNIKPFSEIISITIPKYEGTFSNDLRYILRSSKFTSLTNQDGCGYWNYSSWIKYSSFTRLGSLNSFNQNLILCSTKHLTQFGYLIGGTYREANVSDDVIITPFYQKSLDVISIIGCSLSLLGLLGIWLTAILFPKWRVLATRKVLLHLCFALTLQIVLFLFVNTNNMAERLVQNTELSITCVILGALMQYLILVLFMWMLSTAYLQFQRYVIVLGEHRPPHYVLKSAIICWGVPLIPTLLSSCLDPKSYMPSDYQLSKNTAVCYPSGMSLIFGVFLPITIIVLINLAIFIKVFYSISRTLSQPMQRAERKMQLKKIQLLILLFFMLGIPWVFGILAFIRKSLVYSYLFCFTATLQGFVLFIFYVILDEIARTSWLKLICPALMKKAEHKPTELQSITTTSTNVENNH